MLCWGSASLQDLGLTSAAVPGQRVAAIGCGDGVTAFVKGNGNVTVSLQGGTQRLSNKRKSRPVVLQKREQIVSLACGADHIVLLSDSGRGFEGNCREQSKVVNARPLTGLYERCIIQVACGNHHSLALCEDGQLFAWGQNANGQLGLGKGEPNKSSPQFLKSLSEIPLAQISAGGDHSFALSLSGAVFGWGKNNAGQLGLGDTEDRSAPTPVNSLALKKTVSISCGGEHTVVLTKDGLVYTFGLGSSGQLGHNSDRNELRPRLVAELWGVRVTQIACGRNHTMAYVSSLQRIFTFGCGAQGQLGSGLTEQQPIPLPVTAAADNGTQLFVDRIFAGGSLSFVLSSPNKGSENIPVKKISTVDSEVVEKLISASSSRKINKSKIDHIFGSSSCLNGSFLQQRNDEHYKTAPSRPGINMKQVRHIFKKLKENEKLLAQVQAVVFGKLLPSLSKTPAGVEALRVYLIVPVLVKILKPQKDLSVFTDALTDAVLRLNPHSLSLLESFWTSLPSTSLKFLVKCYKSQSWEYLLKVHEGKDKLQKLLRILTLLYKVNGKVKTPIAEKEFCIKNISLFLPPYERLRKWEVLLTEENAMCVSQLVDLFCHSPFLLDLDVKVQLFYTISFLKKQTFRDLWGGVLCLHFNMRRDHIIEDAFHCLSSVLDTDFKKEFQVTFFGETDRPGVLKKDFFLHLFDKLIEPDFGMFWCNETSTLLWFPTKASVEQGRYNFLGVLCGLAMNNYTTVHLPFPLALFKKLVGVKPTLKDLKELEPVIGKSLQEILDYSEDDIEDIMCSTFTVSWDGTDINLDPNGRDVPVNNENKEQFVDAYVDYVFNLSVKNLFEEFKEGFYKVCDAKVVGIFQPQELMEIMVGKEDYDWDTLKKNTLYGGQYHANHANIIMFWEVFDELTPEQKKAFLLFLTGCDRPPILGMQCIQMTIQVLNNFTQNHFPEALTCHNLLLLPIYSSKERLKIKLIEAINHNRGFWKI
ncbi:probable E3 ubiquitin-protein ligase HERC3 [Amia ocellicauda]|uniref:probable E3 ubiquitin-protein ligase HERC3 n=1 Tax=Amia ocellicauda TaxID=2972642 RepID=UPI003464D83F